MRNSKSRASTTPVTYFSSVKPDLFEHILRKYNTAMGMDPDAMSRNRACADEPSAPERNLICSGN